MKEFIAKNSRTYYFAILSLFLGSLATFGLEYCVQPILPAISEAFSVSPSVASITMSIGLAGMAISMFLIATFADRLKRKRTMVIALTVASILAIIMSVCNNLEIIWALRLIQGLLLAGFPALAVSYVHEEFAPETTGRIIGIYVAGTSVGGFLGRFVTSALTDVFDWRIGLCIMGISYLIIAIAFFFGLPQGKNHVPKSINHMNILGEFKKIFTSPKLMTIYFVGFSVLGSLVTVYNYIPYLLIAPPYELSQTVIGSLFVSYLFGGIAAAILGALADKLGKGNTLSLCIIIFLVGVIVTLSPILWLKILGLIILTVGFFGSHAVACGWVGKCYDGDTARAVSLYMLLYYFGASIMGTVGGLFYASHGWLGVSAFVGAVLTLSLILVLRYRKE